MTELFGFFTGDNAVLMSNVVAFTAFFLIGRLARARQSVSFAFAFTPLLVFFLLEAAATSVA